MQTDAIFSGTLTQTTTATLFQGQCTADWLSVLLNVTAVAAGTTAVFSIQWSLDGGTWADSTADQFDPITAPVCTVKRFDVKAKYWRAICTLTGTSPSITGSANSYS